MKKFFKIVAIVLVLFFIVLITLPVIFKGKIIKTIKTEINKNINASVDFGDVSLSLITSFPNFKFSIKDIRVQGVEQFKETNLLKLKELSLKINLSSIFKKKLDIVSVIINSPEVNLLMLKTGKANWDIAKSKTADTSANTASKGEMPQSEFTLMLTNFAIKNCDVNYQDYSQRVFAEIKNLNYSLSGNFKLSDVVLKMMLDIASLSVKMDGIKYLSNAKISYDADIKADLKDMKFTISKNRFSLNKMLLSLSGYVKKLDEQSVYADIKFTTNDNQFKDLLSMVPKVFTKDYKKITAKGSVMLNGYIKGKISAKQHPTFSVNLKVKDAGFKYPDLPAAATNINVDFTAFNPDGVDDHTVLNLKNFTIKLGENPFSAHYVIKTPVSDPAIEGSVKGKIDFDTLKDVIPVQDIKLKGIFNTDIYLKGRLSYIEKQQFDKFIAKGNFQLTNFIFKTKDFDYDILINNASIVVSPKFFVLKEFKGKIGKSDFRMIGTVSNALGFYLKNEKIRGNFKFSSSLLDLNQLMPKTSQTQAQTQQTAQMQPILIPENLDLNLNLNLKKILFQKLVISNVTGKLGVKNSVASMKDIKMNLIGGSFKINGNFKAGKIATADVTLDLTDIDIQKAFETFNTVKALAPVSQNCKGKISMHLNMKTKIDEKMQPILSSMNGGGYLSSKSIVLGNSDTMNKIASLLKNDKYKKLNLKNIKASFKLKNGDIIISPIKIKMHKSTAIFSGKQSVDTTMDYRLQIEIPYKELTGMSPVIQKLKNKGDKWLKYINPNEKIKVNIHIKGTVKEPKVSLDMQDYVDRLKAKIVADLKKKAEKEARKQADKILKEADRQAAKLLSEAKKKANDIRKAGKKAAQKVVAEADKKIDEMVNKAHGDFAKTLAKEAGKKLKKEARKKAKNIEAEANKRADQLVNETKKQTEKIKKQAREKADELIREAVDAIKL